ncbi:hypothetical protein HHK36_032191 [Tetracentron sinense]|uniref:Uncharacterized protein n=1 Tax=Tetracentron sinense TaxID=13715 RepID=A0A834Y8J7_TETSI|nr:hypothetical protein HHK36_032191 [Tetracentron sinense]
MASTDTREAVAPTCLRIALSNLYPDSNFFQEAQMNDASEVLAVIFDCLHRSFTSGFGRFLILNQKKAIIAVFDELLKLVEMNHQLACDQRQAAVENLTISIIFFQRHHMCFTTVLGWQNTCESAGDISATLAALTVK